MTWTAAVGVGLAALVIHRHPAPLAGPAACPGLLELGGALAARLAPAVPLASMLRVANTVFAVFGAALVVRLLSAAAQSIAIGAAVGLAVASMPIVAPDMAPTAWVPIAAAAWMLAAIQTATPGAPVTAVISLAASAAIAPPLALPYFLIACGICWVTLHGATVTRRAAWLGGTAAGFGLLIAAVTYAMPSLPAFSATTGGRASCLMPMARAAAPGGLMLAVTSVFAGVGPLAASIAALGVFSLRHRLRDQSLWPLAATGAAAWLVTMLSAAAPVRTLAPLVVGFWWLAAAGLREFVTAIGPGIARRIGGAVVIAGVPVFQLASLGDPVAPRPAPLGHESLSGRSFVRLIGALPTDSVLVAEDAIVDMLQRAESSNATVTSKRAAVVSLRADDLGEALAGHRVFALPRAQTDLQPQGFRLQDPQNLFVRGVAEVLPGGACGSIGATWIDLPGATVSSYLAFVADGPDGRGPIIIYLASDAPLRPAPFDWPGLSRRGFFESHYDTSRDADRRQLDADVATDRGPVAHAVLRARIVTRLELWRVPGAPLTLVVSLERAPGLAVARTRDAAPDSRVRVCPSFAHTVSRLQIALK